MQTTLLGTAYVSEHWIEIGSSNGEFFSVYAEFEGFPYDRSRVAYIREVFAENQFSAEWRKLWLRSGEVHVFRAEDFAGYHRSFEMRSSWTTGIRVDFYEVSIPTAASGVDGGIYG